MKVVDLLKHKKDSIARPQLELKELVSPAIKEYWSDLVTKANAQILPWSRIESPSANEGQQRPDASITPISSDVQVTEMAQAKPLTREEPAAEPKPSMRGVPSVDDLPERAQALYHELVANLGEEMHVGDWVHIGQDRINEFANITEDMQWIHTDPERASEESPFKTTIAHGFLTLAMLSRLTDSVDEKNPPFPDAKMTVNIGLNKVRFPYPVKAGSNIRARSSIISVTPVKRGLEIEREIKVEIEGVRRPGCVAVSVIRLYF
ncbi:MAG: MaoC family dehydratase [Vibrio sp.]